VEDMEIRAILDTDVIVDYLKKRPDPDAVQLFGAVRSGRLTANMTTVTVFELCRGAMLSAEPERSMDAVEALRSHVSALPFDEGSARIASEICVSLERKGEAVDVRDLLIGATARAHAMPLVTRKLAHFERVGGVEVTSPRKLLERL